MPRSVRPSASGEWKSRVKTGIATHGVGPCDVAIKSDDIDNSETSNSANLSWRQKVSEPPSAVPSNRMPCGLTLPSINGRARGFCLPSAALSSSKPSVVITRRSLRGSRAPPSYFVDRPEERDHADTRRKRAPVPRRTRCADGQDAPALLDSGP